jgi:C4-dicarboxylate-specific signal transduction histidine kinase
VWVNEKAERIDNQVNRAATITDHMRLFGSDISGVMTELDLHATCEDLQKLRAESMKLQGIEFNCRIDSGEFKVMAQKEELEQVLINILDNAQQSTSRNPAEKQKTVTITAHKDEGGTTISVSDSGMGIEESIINKIFDPFFTTREVGEGAGLGLSVARKLLNDMGASIKATNLEQGGASFFIHFPSESESKAI